MKHCEILLVLLVCIGVSFAANSSKFATVTGQYGTCSDSAGNVYVTSTTNNIIYQIDPETLTPVPYAGTGTAGNKDGNSFTTAQFNQPKGITVNPVTNELYVADYGNNAIRKISGGVVSTVSTDVTGPINIILIQKNGYGYYSQKVNPLGIYVTQDNGQIIYLTEGPDNDDCKGAISLGVLSSAAIIQYGSTSKATADPSAKCKTDYPIDGVWYSFKGNGNLANITTCNSGTVSTARIFVFRDNSPHDDTCANLYCMLNGTNAQGYCTSSNFLTSTVSICTQSETVYYVVVDSEGYNEGQFELRITDGGLTPYCSTCTCSGITCGANNCGGYCAEDCSSGSSCVKGQCVEDSPNSDCTGALVISGNATISGDTRTSLTVNDFLQAGVCAEVYYAGLWYKYVGEGYDVTVSTCSSETNFNTYLHVYEGSAQLKCDKGLYCVDYSSYYYCGFHEISASSIDYCAQKGITYYYYIEGPNYQRGNFELTHTVNTKSSCTA